jgi:hypothetical protein
VIWTHNLLHESPPLYQLRYASTLSHFWLPASAGQVHSLTHTRLTSHHSLQCSPSGAIAPFDFMHFTVKGMIFPPPSPNTTPSPYNFQKCWLPAISQLNKTNIHRNRHTDTDKKKRERIKLKGLWSGTWLCGQSGVVACERSQDRSPVVAVIHLFVLGFWWHCFTARGSRMWMPIVVDCLLCYPSITLFFQRLEPPNRAG